MSSAASPAPAASEDPFAGIGSPTPSQTDDNPFADFSAPSAPTPAPMQTSPPAPTTGNINPYAAPMGAPSVASTTGGSSAESLRNQHIQQEASIKSIGSLYMIGGTLGTVFGAIGMVGAIIGLAQGGEEAVLILGMVVLYLSFGAGFLLMGMGLRKLNGAARIAAIVMSCLGLLGFPFGTLIHGYFLYLLLNEKAGVIFSERYREAVRQTPHIKPQMSFILKVLLAILIVLVVFILGIVVLGLILG